MALVACCNPSQVDAIDAVTVKPTNGRSTPGDDEVDPHQIVDICREKWWKMHKQKMVFSSNQDGITHDSIRLYHLNGDFRGYIRIHPKVPATLSNAKPQSWISRGTKRRCCTKGAHRKYFLGLTVSSSQPYKEKLWLKMFLALQDRSLTFTCHCKKKQIAT